MQAKLIMYLCYNAYFANIRFSTSFMNSPPYLAVNFGHRFSSSASRSHLITSYSASSRCTAIFIETSRSISGKLQSFLLVWLFSKKLPQSIHRFILDAFLRNEPV